MSNHSSTTRTKAGTFRRFRVTPGLGRRRRWTDEEKARLVAESLDPATTASAVARRYGLHARQPFVWREHLRRATPAAAQLFVWRRQLRRATSAAAGTIAGPGFVPVLMAEGGAPPAEAAGRMEIA